MKKILFVLLIISSLFVSGCSDNQRESVVTKVMIPELIKGQATTAMYMSIENKTIMPKRLIGVKLEEASETQIHSTTYLDGMMQMRHLEYLDIPAKTQVDFEPGGLHVMLLGFEAALTPGMTISIELIFEASPNIRVIAKVIAR